MKKTKSKLRIALLGNLLLAGLLFLAVEPAQAINVFEGCNGNNSAVCAEASGGNVAGLVSNVTGLLFFLIGAIAVIVIIIAGIKYITADGDASKIKGAKDSLLYAVVGLIVSVLSYAIVIFIVNWFK